MGHFLDQAGKGAWDSVKGVPNLVNEIDPQSPQYVPRNPQYRQSYEQNMKALGEGLLKRPSTRRSWPSRCSSGTSGRKTLAGRSASWFPAWPWLL